MRNRRSIAGAPLALLLLAPPAAAAPRQQPDGLPASAVLTNLRSPTGRTVYLVLRPRPEEAALVQRQAEELARGLGARLKARAAGPLWVIWLSHPSAGLDVHRRGQVLTMTLGGPTHAQLHPLHEQALQAGVRLDPRMPDGDQDQEILLKARHAMRSGDAPPALVTLAQGAAARVVLARYAGGDDLGASLWGARYLPVLAAHPDAALLTEIIKIAGQALEVKVREVSAPPPPIGPLPPGPGDEAAAAADARARAARAFLAQPAGEAHAASPREGGRSFSEAPPDRQKQGEGLK